MYQWQFFVLLYVEAKAQAQITEKTKQQINIVNSTASSSSSRPIFYGEIPLRAPNDDENAYCRNGGITIGHRCICPYPYTGARCLDFACVHGISVGIRYDPDSLFFNKPCICDDGWRGDLCDISKANQLKRSPNFGVICTTASECKSRSYGWVAESHRFVYNMTWITVILRIHCNERGEFRNGHCQCTGHFFGPQCQYVSRCDHGKWKHGRCICVDGWEGDYCQDIICQHGYPDAENNSQSCVCPARFSGIHCDRCTQQGPKIRPYPECNIDVLKIQARLQRQKAEMQFRSRLRILGLACILLFLLAVTMIVVNRLRNARRKRSATGNLRERELEVRKTVLQEAVRPNKRISDERKRSPEQRYSRTELIA